MVADVTVVGAGVIALASAVELGDRGMRVRLVGTTHSGEASSASGGMLAPSVEREMGPAHTFALASRDLFGTFVAGLEERTGILVPLNQLGIVETATSAARAAQLSAVAPSTSRWLPAQDVQEIEPALAPDIAGALLHPDDGCVDPLRLLDALRAAVAAHPQVTVVSEDVVSLRGSDGAAVVETDRERRLESGCVVVAAGAWTPLIAGTRPLPIEPLRGQMVAYAAEPLRHVVYTEYGYLVPRGDGHTVAGSTAEHAGFVAATTEDGIHAVRRAAEAACPALREAPVATTWAGLRPMTPDGLPLLGRDPDMPSVVYACGHSRNGILLTPATAEVVADCVSGTESRYDLTRFRPERFSR